MDADRKKKSLPAFVPRTWPAYSLDPEERRKLADDNGEDYGVAGLMCDSDDGDGDCDMLEVESQPDCFGCCGRAMQAHGSGAQRGECDYMCFGCESEEEEEEIATIQLDASRGVLAVYRHILLDAHFLYRRVVLRVFP